MEGVLRDDAVVREGPGVVQRDAVEDERLLRRRDALFVVEGLFEEEDLVTRVAVDGNRLALGGWLGAMVGAMGKETRRSGKGRSERVLGGGPGASDGRGVAYRLSSHEDLHGVWLT